MCGAGYDTICIGVRCPQCHCMVKEFLTKSLGGGFREFSRDDELSICENGEESLKVNHGFVRGVGTCVRCARRAEKMHRKVEKMVVWFAIREGRIYGPRRNGCNGSVA